jgi:hypothetical protein
MEYKILEAVNSSELEQIVNQFLFRGWKISGGVSLCSYIVNNKVLTHYAQSVYLDNNATMPELDDNKKKELKKQYKKIYNQTP